MGGNAKHMPHVWEHYDATFDEIFTLLESLTVGSVYTTEKFDGVNIHFRVDNQGVVRFSRSASDINNGGFTFADALNLYESHPARDTFIEGFRAIDEHFSGVWWPFSYSGSDWVNTEIVASFREQLLKYDNNAIVMHEVVTFLPKGRGKVVDPVKQAKLSTLAEADVTTTTNRSWAVLPPTQINLPNEAGNGYLSDAVNRLNTCMNAAGLNRNNTLREFLRYSLLAGPISGINTTQSVREKLADKISGTNPGIRLVDLKKGQPAGIAEKISFYGRKQNELKHRRTAMSPIINTIDCFASARLENITSVLIEDAAHEKNRIMETIQNDADLVNESADSYQGERIEMFNRLFSEWKQVSQLPAAIEGVTFQFRDLPTKITGGFATLNQLLGVCRYGRGNVPPVSGVVRANNNTQISPEWFAIK